MHFVPTDTKAREKLTSLLTNTTLKDLTRLSPCYQTSSLESFHSVVIHYAPNILLSHTVEWKQVSVLLKSNGDMYTIVLTLQSVIQ